MLGYINNIRTFIYPKLGSETFFNTCLSKCKSLRVLNLESSSLEVLPYSIGTLKQLRFLNLSLSKKIKKLPNSLCKLHSLQFLDLSGCSELEELPKDMKYMISLRVLVLTTKHKSLSETGIECLKSLRTLELENCKNLEYLFAGMECPPALETLEISDCPMLISLPRALKCLTSLKNLHIADCQELDLGMEFESEDVNIMLSLQRLRIHNLPKLINLPSWLLRGSLKSLESIILYECENLTELPESLPSFTSLEELYIQRCPSLETLPRGMKRLTSLKKLCISNCESLNLTVEEENDDEDQLSESKLEKLAIARLPKLTTLPKWLLQWSMLSLETLWISDCQQLKTLSAVFQSLASLKSLYIIKCPLLIESCKTGEDIHRTAHVEKIITITNDQKAWIVQIFIPQRENLTELPESLPSLALLKFLRIEGCPSLITLPRGMNRLSALKKLLIMDCESLNLTMTEGNDQDQLGGLKLQILGIVGLPKLKALPQWLLQGSILSLESMCIAKCRQLKTLPVVIPSLTSLKSLYIINCPQLTERCKTGIGENIYKIALVQKWIIINCDQADLLEENSFFIEAFFGMYGATLDKAFKSVLQGILLSSKGEKLNSMNLLLYTSPVAVIVLWPAVLMVEPNVF
ncbi:hypothetical protein ACFE04_012113 [Oxalis oulophora]